MDYPATLEIDVKDKVARWRPLFSWILAIPHFVVMYALNIVSEVVGVISWFAILFTGKLPAGLANVQCMCLRYQARVMTFAAGLHEQYPPFTFESTPQDPGGYPARANYSVSLEGRNRLTCALRIIWAIPAVIMMLIIGIIGWICWFIGAIAVLFTGTWPSGLRDWVVKAMRMSVRVNAYVWLLTDEYPPLSFD